MARRPNVYTKNGHWYSEAGGKARYFGKVEAVTQAEAMGLLWRALAGDGSREPEAESRRPKPEARSQEPEAQHPHPPSLAVSYQEPQAPSLSVKALTERFLAWAKANRSEKTHIERERHLARFAERHGDMPVDSLAERHIEAFTESLIAKAYAPDYIHKHHVSIKAMINKGVKMGWIKPIDPFARVEPIRLIRRPLLESDLPTDTEVKALIVAGDHYDDMGDLLRLYHATGARTHELIEAKVGDYQPKSRTLILARHKRSKTMREPVPRTITLNDEAMAIIQKHCEGRRATDPIFVRPTMRMKPYTSIAIGIRFQNVRRRAGVRDDITIYSLRHLWISEALMAGIDSLIVAKMAGTSTKMVETVYGHFRQSALVEAQAVLDKARGVLHRR